MPTKPALDRGNIAGIVLAGGKSRRMGGQDKGLMLVAGRPMAAWATALLAPQVDQLLLNANRNREQYQALGASVIEDQLADFQGPLAGMAAGLAAIDHDYAAFIPCDSPLLPADLVERLWDAMTAQQADLAVAHDGQRMQPVCALLRRELLPSLRATLANGERKVDRWYAQLQVALADLSDPPNAFLNANTPEQLAELEQRLLQHPPKP